MPLVYEVGLKALPEPWPPKGLVLIVYGLIKVALLAVADERPTAKGTSLGSLWIDKGCPSSGGR